MLTYSAVRTKLRNEGLGHCIHNPPSHCIESGNITWDNNVDRYLHLRFDHCVCNDEPVKRCDCIIFRFEQGAIPSVYVIEVKQGNPNLTEVQEKIQYCLDKVTSLFPNNNADFRVVPTLCASSFHGLEARAFLSYRVKIRGKKVLINKRLHRESINNI